MCQTSCSYIYFFKPLQRKQGVAFCNFICTRYKGEGWSSGFHVWNADEHSHENDRPLDVEGGNTS